MQQGADAVDRFDREEAGAERLEEPGELARARGEVQDGSAGSDPQMLRAPRHAVGRVAGSGLLVARRLAVEPRIGHVVDGHRAMMAGVTTQESISFDKVAAIYDATRGGLERGMRFAAAVAPHCSVGPVLEIGVGTAAIAKPLRERLGRTVLGVDLSIEMLRQGQRRLGATVAAADVTRLPVRTSSVGTVLACWLLHLVGDPATTLHEVTRVLRPGGRLAVVSSRGELEPDDVDSVMIDLHDVLRGRLDVRDRLVPLAQASGLDLVAEDLTEAGTWQESPEDLVQRMERRQWGVLIDLDETQYVRHVQPVVDRLRGPARARAPRTRLVATACSSSPRREHGPASRRVTAWLREALDPTPQEHP